jgi:hypothetical protein
MTKMAGLLFFASILLIFSSCSKKNTTDPPAPQTIVVTVNDTARVFAFNVVVNVIHTSTGYSANFRAYQTGTGNSIYLFLDNFKTGSNSLGVSTGNDVEVFDGPENFYDSNIHGGSGSIVVTQFDTINKTLVGTFNARVYSRADSLAYIDVSNGGFSLQYQ